MNRANTGMNPMISKALITLKRVWALASWRASPPPEVLYKGCQQSDERDPDDGAPDVEHGVSDSGPQRFTRLADRGHEGGYGRADIGAHDEGDPRLQADEPLLGKNDDNAGGGR